MNKKNINLLKPPLKPKQNECDDRWDICEKLKQRLLIEANHNKSQQLKSIDYKTKAALLATNAKQQISNLEYKYSRLLSCKAELLNKIQDCKYLSEIAEKSINDLQEKKSELLEQLNKIKVLKGI